MISSADGRERNERILHQSMRLVLDGLESCCTTGFGVVAKNDIELNWFAILALYCFDFREENNKSEIRNNFSLRNPCVRSLSMMKNIQQRRCMRAGASTDTGQARAEKKDLLIFEPIRVVILR